MFRCHIFHSYRRGLSKSFNFKASFCSTGVLSSRKRWVAEIVNSDNHPYILTNEINNTQTAEIAVRRLLKRFPGVDAVELQESVRPKDGRPPPRRQILYADVAPLVGLDPHHPSFHNFPVFYLNQSRIPTGLLKSIVQEMDVLQFQHSPIHGPDPDEHNACEQFSRMLSPVFTRLASCFGGVFETTLKTFKKGPTASRRRIQHYYGVLYGPTPILVIEMEEFPDAEEGSQGGLFDAFLYAIDECHRLEFENCRVGGITALPIYCILRHANSFHFFKFTRVSNSEKGTFQLGWVSGRPGTYKGLHFPTYSWSNPQTYFILHLRAIAECIFDHMLNGYVCSLEAMTVMARKRLADGRNPEFYEKRIRELEVALAPVERMKEIFSKAEAQWQDDDIAAADANVVDAFALLEESTEAIRRDIVPIMAAWDDDRVG